MKILGAILHQPVTVPGVIPPSTFINSKKLPGIQLKWDDDRGLAWKIKTKAGEREGFFPMATVSCVEVESGSIWEVEKDKKKAA